MKTWHLKKGAQKAIEAITGVSMFTLLGVCGVDSKLGCIILLTLILNTVVGLTLLNKYGRY